MESVTCFVAVKLVITKSAQNSKVLKSYRFRQNDRAARVIYCFHLAENHETTITPAFGRSSPDMHRHIIWINPPILKCGIGGGNLSLPQTSGFFLSHPKP